MCECFLRRQVPMGVTRSVNTCFLKQQVHELVTSYSIVTRVLDKLSPAIFYHVTSLKNLLGNLSSGHVSSNKLEELVV